MAYINTILYSWANIWKMNRSQDPRPTLNSSNAKISTTILYLKKINLVVHSMQLKKLKKPSNTRRYI